VTSAGRSETALILAPVGRDAAVASGMLREARIASLICPDLDSLVRELSGGMGFAVVTEEALLGRDLRRLRGHVDQGGAGRHGRAGPPDPDRLPASRGLGS
jgi:hypothetical protein